MCTSSHLCQDKCNVNPDKVAIYEYWSWLSWLILPTKGEQNRFMCSGAYRLVWVGRRGWEFLWDWWLIIILQRSGLRGVHAAYVANEYIPFKGSGISTPLKIKIKNICHPQRTLSDLFMSSQITFNLGHSKNYLIAISSSVQQFVVARTYCTWKWYCMIFN